jgi:glycosyltransferase involved in cell wall biosynthesis
VDSDCRKAEPSVSGTEEIRHHDMKPLVSILIPAFNAEEWIEDTIASAVAQTWAHKEIIIVDDGSTDRTLEIARRHASKNVLVIGQENQGGAAARNTAFAHAQGDYIQWLDADDLLSEDKIEKQLALAMQCADSRVVISCPWAYFMYRVGAAKFSRSPLWQDLEPVAWVLQKWTHNAHMQTATWLVGRNLLQSVGPWNPELLSDDDGEYFTRVVLASRGVRFEPNARVFYRIVGNRRLSYIGRSDRKLEAHIKGMRLQIQYVRALEDTPRVQAAIVRYLQTWLPAFYPERPDLVAELQGLAANVGGLLQTPRVSWKYRAIAMIFGYGTAKRIQLQYNEHKTAILRSFDKLVFQLLPKRQRITVGS